MGTFTHWVLYDIPADIHELPENLPKDKVLPNGTKQGITDFKKFGYGGPCPPSGTHRYYFKLYALDTLLNLEPALKKEDILKAMNGHILAQGQIMGKYARI
jgi:Raf kinase inhibitor-like YbhB/YbcL family protein